MPNELWWQVHMETLLSHGCLGILLPRRLFCAYTGVIQAQGGTVTTQNCIEEAYPGEVLAGLVKVLLH